MILTQHRPAPGDANTDPRPTCYGESRAAASRSSVRSQKRAAARPAGRTCRRPPCDRPRRSGRARRRTSRGRRKSAIVSRAISQVEPANRRTKPSRRQRRDGRSAGHPRTIRPARASAGGRNSSSRGGLREKVVIRLVVAQPEAGSPAEPEAARDENQGPEARGAILDLESVEDHPGQSPRIIAFLRLVATPKWRKSRGFFDLRPTRRPIQGGTRGRGRGRPGLSGSDLC